MALSEHDLSASLMVELFGKLASEPDVVVERVASLFEIRDPNNSLEALRAEVQAGKMPVLVANYQSLADGPALSIVTSQLGIGFNLPVASSIDQGHQGELVRVVNFHMDPVLRVRNLVTVPIITASDVEKRAMIKDSNARAMGALRHTADNGRGFAMMPEASVEGGRKRGAEEIIGMVRPPNPSTFVRWLDIFAKQGQDPVILPIGIEGSYKVFNPDNYTFPEHVLQMLLGNAQPEKIATITLGRIIPFRKLRTGPLSDDFFMTRIAELLPESSRGAYRSSAK